jgi:hypothetical protein
MNIDQAKSTISIAEILDKVGAKPHKITEKEGWYFSPFREEKTASFHVLFKKNLWFDRYSGSKWATYSGLNCASNSG